MPRDLPISNGNLMINFEHEYNIRDVYWPHVGQDNQTVGDVSFFGVWCDGKFAWIGDTIFFDPDLNGLVAYKGMRYVALNGQIDDQFGFQSFAIGSKERDGYQ